MIGLVVQELLRELQEEESRPKAVRDKESGMQGERGSSMGMSRRV